jgi:hypothetical protein
MKLGRQKAGTRQRLLTLRSSRRNPEPSVRQELIGHAGFAATISTAPPTAAAREQRVPTTLQTADPAF